MAGREHTIIDLTNSDEEEGATTTQTPNPNMQLPQSHHGLPSVQRSYPPILSPSYARRPQPSLSAASASSPLIRTTGAALNSRPSLAHSPSQHSNPPPAKRRRTEDSLSPPLQIQNEELIRNVLAYQIFPHIVLRTDHYKGRLHRSDRDQIGQQTAAEVVKRPDFLPHFTANGLRLSAEYEDILAIEACAIVDKLAFQLISSYKAQPNYQSRSASSEDPEDHVFEGEIPIDRPLPTPITRDYSSSPATSFSDEHAETMPQKRKRLRRSTRPVLQTEPPQEERRRSQQPAKSSQEDKSYSGEDITRPYISVLDRQGRPEVVNHFDFLPEEILFICAAIQSPDNQAFADLGDSAKLLTTLMIGKKVSQITPLIHQRVQVPGPELGRTLLRCRGKAAITLFLEDAANGRLLSSDTPLEVLHPPPCDSIHYLIKLLRDREMLGIAPLPTASGRKLFGIEAMSCLEDSLVPRTEWFDCCGDIATMCWTSDSAFVCGATAHSDNSNMQYNKPGNLLLGSLPTDELKSIHNHRIPRPIVEIDENNASASANASSWMRETQDPWLYTSVVSTSYSEALGLTFTASFDKSVKVWRVAQDGAEMKLLGTWDHENKVNFVVASNDIYEPRVATAADVSNDAIRVYVVNRDDVAFSPYDTYSGERAQEQAKELRRRDTWAYFPATIQWGRCPSMWNLLLVGYSPRSVTHDDMDIPLEKKNTGELCLWDVADDGKKISIPSARLSNVFEVLWHPTQPCFLAATSPGALYDPLTRTQIRIFVQRQGFEDYQFMQVKTLDCSALDINELSIMPNSPDCSFVTASCTDGNTYVWDTALGDKAIHILNHGESLDHPPIDRPREEGDNGVKFAAWGQSADRFYTGSTDGKVKAWDVRAPPKKAFVRDVLEVSGGITVGAFSKDHSKLLIGDATGKVHLLAYDDSDLVEPIATPPNVAASLNPLLRATSGRGCPGQKPISKRPKAIKQHKEPTKAQLANGSPEEDDAPKGREFLEQNQLIIHPDPRIGVVQGPNYHSTAFFRMEAHQEGDGTQPLIAEFEAKQNYNNLALRPKRGQVSEVTRIPTVSGSSKYIHEHNCKLERQIVTESGLELDWDYLLAREENPSFRKIFATSNNCAREESERGRVRVYD